ncbi:MAG: HD domain-containing protein [Acidobacteria bacterium]|nr:HD domain-containing protein [Acidobacteriota bacterium]
MAIGTALQRLVRMRPGTMGRAGALRLFVGVVGVAGLLVMAHSLAALPYTPQPLQWITLGVLATVAGTFALRVPGVPVQVSVSDTFFFSSALLFGPAPATVAIAIDSFLISWRSGHTAQRLIFNIACPPLALWIGAQAFFAMIGAPSLSNESSISSAAIVLPLVVLTTLYFVVNSGLTAIAVSLERDQPVLGLWQRHFAGISLCHFAAASASFFLVVAVRSVSVLALAAVLPLLVMFQIAMRSWLGRVGDAQRHVAEVDRLYLSTIEALSAAIKAKDGATSHHVRRVQRFALSLARELGVEDPAVLQAIQTASLLHDTGKLAVPERILNKPGALTPAEFETMKLHVDVGADILSSIEFPYPVVPIVRSHHENWDGSGYPRGLKGDEIPIGARILSVVDCFDAVTSDRPYHAARTDQEALAIIIERRGKMYDPQAVDAFVRVYRSTALDAAARNGLDEAVRRITRSVAVEASPALVPATSADQSSLPRELLTLMSLSRVVAGQPTVSDVAQLAWTHLQRLNPAKSCVIFVASARGDEIVARFAAGASASELGALSMGLGQHLSGWVAAHRQPMVNSDARLDLGVQRVSADLRYCLSVPLVHGDHLTGVITLYGRNRFSADHVKTMQMMAPHIAEMLERATCLEAGDRADPSGRPRHDLRVVKA